MSSSQTSNFLPIFGAAVENYQKLTGQDLATHPLSSEIRSSDTPDSVLAILQEQVRGVEAYKNIDPKLASSLRHVVGGLSTISNAEIPGSVSLSKFFIYLSVNSNAYLLGP